MARPHAAMGFAHVHCANANSDAAGHGLVHDELADLADQLLLDLQPRAEIVHDAVVLGEADDFTVGRRQHAHECLAVDRHQVVRAGGAHLDRSRHQQLAEALGILELSDIWRLGEPPLHGLLDEHLCDTFWRVARIVIVLVIDLQDIQQLRDFCRG
jgi:hypothetical protein